MSAWSTRRTSWLQCCIQPWCRIWTGQWKTRSVPWRRRLARAATYLTLGPCCWQISEEHRKSCQYSHFLLLAHCFSEDGSSAAGAGGSQKRARREGATVDEKSLFYYKFEEDMLAAVRRARPHLVVVNTDRMLSRAAGVTCVYVPGDAEDQLYQRCSHEAVPAMHVGSVQAVPGVCKGARDHVPAATGGKRKQVDFVPCKHAHS